MNNTALSPSTDGESPYRSDDPSNTREQTKRGRRSTVSQNKRQDEIDPYNRRISIKDESPSHHHHDDFGFNLFGRVGRTTGKMIYKTLVWPMKWLLPHCLSGILTLLFTLITFYLIGISVKNVLGSVISMNSILQPIRAISIPIVYIYCYLIGGTGTFCNRRNNQVQMIGQIARSVGGTAKQASDIFDSVVQLSDPTHLGLYQTEILELAFAVRWSNSSPQLLDDKSILVDGLFELSLLTRQIKDLLIDLNGQGLNTFSFIAFQFSRLGDLIEWVQKGKKPYTTETIRRNLDILFQDLSRELDKLLNTIEGLIPIASRSTNLGIQISELLYRQRYQLEDKKINQNIWNLVLDLTSWKGTQLDRDLRLTDQSIQNLKSTWLKLEDIRTDLLTYRNNVSNFKASFTGWHLAEHGLSPEDELFSMRQVIEKFKHTIKSVKSNSRPSNHLLSSTGP